MARRQARTAPAVSEEATEIERARTLLGAEAADMTDDQIAEVIRQADVVAKSIIDTFVAKGPR